MLYTYYLVIVLKKLNNMPPKIAPIIIPRALTFRLLEDISIKEKKGDL